MENRALMLMLTLANLAILSGCAVKYGDLQVGTPGGWEQMNKQEQIRVKYAQEVANASRN